MNFCNTKVYIKYIRSFFFKVANLKKKKNATHKEAFEDSDDGDEEGRECEYITDSSASDSELEKEKEEGLKSVAEEKGLKNLLDNEDDESSDTDEDTAEKSEEGSVSTRQNQSHVWNRDARSITDVSRNI